jgi:hypothetical protein
LYRRLLCPHNSFSKACIQEAGITLPLPFSEKLEEPDETEHLQQVQNDPYQDIETAYVAQLCSTSTANTLNWFRKYLANPKTLHATTTVLSCFSNSKFYCKGF